MAKSTTRIVNIGLHGSSLATRFLFIFFLAKYLSSAEVGYYGLFTATVGYALYFVGLDFYTYVTRELVKTPAAQRGRLLKGQAALSGILYLLFLPPACAWVFAYSGWPSALMLWFVPILLLEHFNQEMSRLLIALSEQITASVVLFVRQGSWALAAVALMTWQGSSRRLAVVMALWAAAGLAAALIALAKLKRLGFRGWAAPLDWAWIARGVAVSAAFLGATLALRGIQTFDRYWLEALGGIEVVAAYVLFLGVAGSLLGFLDAGVFSFTYPALIKLSHEQDQVQISAKVRQMLLATVVVSAGFAVVSWWALPHLLHWIGKETYFSALHFYPWLLLAMVVNALGLVPHYALYAAGQDKPIIASHLAALATFAAAVAVLANRVGPLAVPQGLLAAFTLILVWKTAAYRRHVGATQARVAAPQAI